MLRTVLWHASPREGLFGRLGPQGSAEAHVAGHRALPGWEAIEPLCRTLAACLPKPPPCALVGGPSTLPNLGAEPGQRPGPQPPSPLPAAAPAILTPLCCSYPLGTFPDWTTEAGRPPDRERSWRHYYFPGKGVARPPQASRGSVPSRTAPQSRPASRC